MDDLYGNAWGDPLNDYSNQPYPLPTWNTQPSSPKPPSPVGDDQSDGHANDDENEDPPTETQFRAETSDASWTADAVPWPVEEGHIPYHPAWVPVSPANVWSPTAQPQTAVVPTPTPPDHIPPSLPPFASLTLPEEPKEERSAPPEQTQGTPVQSRASTPDQFGTFESGNTDAVIPVEEVGWGLPGYSAFGDPVESSNAWNQRATVKERDMGAEPMDEWEAARLTKEKIDRRVPPEIIASIIETVEKFSGEMWPQGSSSSSNPQEEWLQSWRRGLDGVEGLNSLLDTLLLEHPFTPRVPFAKSAVAREMNKSLRLTRHSPITRFSPMAHFMRNKGSSLDWETAVKNRSDEVPDDMPVGWRIVEKKEEILTSVDTKKKSGLFSSFWNRREGSTSLPSIPDTKAPILQHSTTDSFPTKPTSIAELTDTPPIAPSRTASQSPGQSVAGPGSPSVSSSRLTKPPPVPPVLTASVSASSTNAASPVSLTSADTVASPVDSTPTTDGPAQSAVSRFLSRFSRPKSTAGNGSLSLSSEDLDFLSDVPVVHGTSGVGDEDDDVPLGKHKVMMENEQGSALAAPLAATPLRANTTNRSPPQAVLGDDFDALFNTPIAQPQRPPFQPPSRPSSVVPQKGIFRPPSTVPQIDISRGPTGPSRPQTPSFPVVRMSSTSSSNAVPFLIPPPPASPLRPATPQPSTSTETPPITTSVPTILPPPSQKPSETNLFDDDEFSGFLSSSQRPPAANGTRTLSLSAQIDSFGSLNPITPSTSQQPILQTSNGSSSLMVSPVSDTADDAWGFDDFEGSTPATSTAANPITGTPPTRTAANQLSASKQWLSKPSPPPPPVPSKSGSSTPSSLTSSPLGLGPPPKSQSVPKQRPLPFNLPSSEKKQPPHSRSHSRRVSAEDHSHTMQLMNNASKRGAWPAPLSPLPEVLAPPPPPSSTVNSRMTSVPSSKVLLDINDDGPFSRAQEKPRLLNSTVSVIGPSEDGSGVTFSNTRSRKSGGLFSIPPPPAFSSRTSRVPPRPEQEQSLLDFDDFESPRTASIPKPTPRTDDKSGVGLSAQDLSFFEGF